jgi:hypothetical protein
MEGRTMKKLIVALILGVAVGYGWGYGEGNSGQRSVVARTLDHFGASKLRAEQAARDKLIDAAGKP